MWDNTIMVLVSDNGGPLDHSTNFPLRAGKGSLFDGGVRVEAWIHSPLLPPAVRGTVWDGMAHSADWYVTFVEGKVRVFRQEFALEDAIEIHAFALLEALPCMRPIPFLSDVHCLLPLPP
jgi:arylsulfatase A-like enzyme